MTELDAGADNLVIANDALGRPERIEWTGSAAGTFSYGYDGSELVTREGFESVEEIDLEEDWTFARDVSRTTGRLDREIVENDAALDGTPTVTALHYAVSPTAPFVADPGAAPEPFFTASVDRTNGGVTATSALGLALIGRSGITSSDTAVSPESFREALHADVTGGGLRTAYGASLFGEITSARTTDSTGQLWFREHICERDQQGRVLRRIETYREPDGATGTRERYIRWRYQYDAQDRLSYAARHLHTTPITCGTRTGGSPVLATYGYDTNTGNRRLAGSSYNGDDQLTAETGRSHRYDGRGRLDRTIAGSTVTTYAWDTMSHLRSVTQGSTSTSYQYDPAGRLIAARPSSGEAEYFVYRNGLEPVAWSRGDVHQYFVYGSLPHVPDLIYEDEDDDTEIDSVYRVVTDERGSVRMLLRIDPTGPVVVQLIEYDAWGAPTFTLGTDTVQPFGFAGSIWLRQPRLWHMGARDYDPRIGRWITKDPIRFAGGTNLYVYSENDPINYLDPTGGKSSQGWWAVLLDVSVLPTTLLGVAIGSASPLPAREDRGGVVEYYTSPFLQFDRAPAAITIGNVIVYRDDPCNVSELTREHERAHVSQFRTLGNLYLPAHSLGQSVSIPLALVDPLGWRSRFDAPAHTYNPMEWGPVTGTFPGRGPAVAWARPPWLEDQ